MMFPISYLVCSVNYFVCLLIDFVYGVIYLRANQVGGSLGFMVYNNHPCPWAPSSVPGGY